MVLVDFKGLGDDLGQEGDSAVVVLGITVDEDAHERNEGVAVLCL